MGYLPVEVLMIIAQFLTVICAGTPALQRNTLTTLLVSRAWYKSMRDVVWSDICLCSATQVDLFIQTIWKKRHLGSVVRNLRFEFPAHRNEVPMAALHPIVRSRELESRQLIGNRLFTEMGLPNRAKYGWLAGLKCNAPWHWFSILTLLLPKLEVFDIAPGYLRSGMENIYQVLAYLSEMEPPPLMNLKHFRVQKQLGTGSTYHLEFLIPLLQIPSVNKLYLSGLSLTRTISIERYFSSLPQIRGPSKIRHLKLRFDSPDWNGPRFLNFMSRFEALESFSIEMVDRAPATPQMALATPATGWARTVWQALFRHAPTLRHLQLVQTGAVDLATIAGQNPHWFGSLAEFGQLQELEISLNNLFNRTFDPIWAFPKGQIRSLTPENLRRLVVLGVRPRDLSLLAATMRELLAVRKTNLSRWESLEIPRTMGVWKGSQCSQWENYHVKFCKRCSCCQMAERLWLECEARGISFSTYDDSLVGGKPTW